MNGSEDFCSMKMSKMIEIVIFDIPVYDAYEIQLLVPIIHSATLF